MGDEDDGEMLAMLEIGKERVEALLRIGVDASGGLVEKEHTGLTTEGAGYVHPLLLTTGELANASIGEVLYAGALEGGKGGGAFVYGVEVGCGTLGGKSAAGYLVDRSGKIHRGDALRDITEIVPLTKILERSTKKSNAPGSRPEEPKKNLEEGGLAAAIGPDNADILSRGDSAGNIVQHRLPLILKGHVVRGNERGSWHNRLTSAEDAGEGGDDAGELDFGGSKRDRGRLPCYVGEHRLAALDGVFAGNNCTLLAGHADIPCPWLAGAAEYDFVPGGDEGAEGDIV